MGLRYREGEHLPELIEQFLREPDYRALAVVCLMPFGTSREFNYTFPVEIWRHLLSFLLPSYAPTIGTTNPTTFIGYIMIRRCLIVTLEQYINRRGTLYRERAIEFIKDVYTCQNGHALMLLVKNQFKPLKRKKPHHGTTSLPGMFDLFMKTAGSKTEDKFITIIEIFTKRLSGNDAANEVAEEARRDKLAADEAAEERRECPSSNGVELIEITARLLSSANVRNTSHARLQEAHDLNCNPSLNQAGFCIDTILRIPYYCILLDF